MKRCLVLQGGGLRGAFVAGACFALADLHIFQFDLALAVSASVPTLAYFLAGQCREGREVWENYNSLVYLQRKTVSKYLVYEVVQIDKRMISIIIPQDPQEISARTRTPYTRLCGHAWPSRERCRKKRS